VITVAAGIVVGFGAGLVLASRDALSLPDPVGWLVVGLAVAWAGMLLRLWQCSLWAGSSRLPSWSGRKQTVVSSGPYRFVRHPSYLGLLILLFGFGLALGDLASAAVMVVLPALGLMWRIRVEEAALRAGLGDGYLEYCNDRACLIPGIW